MLVDENEDAHEKQHMSQLLNELMHIYYDMKVNDKDASNEGYYVDSEELEEFPRLFKKSWKSGKASKVRTIPLNAYKLHVENNARKNWKPKKINEPETLD